MTNTNAMSERLELELGELMGRLQALAGEIRLHVHSTGRRYEATRNVESASFELERDVAAGPTESIDRLRQLGHELQGRLKRLRE
jgi:hypothetical protein